MKKILVIFGITIFIIIVVLLGFYFYTISLPPECGDGCFDSKSNGVLENCIKYYNGCNTCTIENGMITSCTEKFCPGNIGEPGCVEFK